MILNDSTRAFQPGQRSTSTGNTGKVTLIEYVLFSIRQTWLMIHSETVLGNDLSTDERPNWPLSSFGATKCANNLVDSLDVSQEEASFAQIPMQRHL